MPRMNYCSPGSPRHRPYPARTDQGQKFSHPQLNLIRSDEEFMSTIARMFKCTGLKKKLREPEFHRALLILSKHPEYKNSVRSKVIDIAVQSNYYGSGSVYALQMTRGLKQTLSMKQIFHPSCPYECLETVGRRSIQSQITSFVMQFWKQHPSGVVNCPVSGDLIRKSDRKSYDVDHWGKGFDELLKSWVVSQSVPVTQLKYNLNKTALLKCSEHWMRDWEEYHRRHAVLKVLSSSANRSKSGIAAFANEKHRYRLANPFKYQPVNMVNGS